MSDRYAGLGAAIKEAISWGDATFPRETLRSLSVHIRKEARELRRDPTDPHEIADVLMLTFALANKAGVDVVSAFREKLAICKAREWGEPDADGVTEHVR